MVSKQEARMKKYPHPVTGKLVSQKCIIQLNNVAKGMCRYHSKRVAAHAGYCEQCVDKLLKFKGTKGPGTPPKADWLKVEWSKPLKDLAAQLGVSYSSVWRNKKIHGK